MEEVQFTGAVSTSDPYNYRQAIQAAETQQAVLLDTESVQAPLCS